MSNATYTDADKNLIINVYPANKSRAAFAAITINGTHYTGWLNKHKDAAFGDGWCITCNKMQAFGDTQMMAARWLVHKIMWGTP